MKKITFLGAILYTVFCFAQNSTSAWIDFSKPHVKFFHDKDQLVRINFFAIEGGFFKQGVSLQDIPLSKIRVFNNGQQVPLLITDNNNNNIWDPNDYIEIVAHKNDGSLDTALYQYKSHQRHSMQSLYTDKRAYYVTYRDNGVQAKYANATNTPLAAGGYKPYHTGKKSYCEDQAYFTGKTILLGSQEAVQSEYTEGEGFYGSGKQCPRLPNSGPADSTVPLYTYLIDAPFIDVTGFDPKIEIGTININAYYDFYTHWLIYKASPNGSTVARRLGDTITRTLVHVVKTLNLKKTDFDQNGILLQMYNGPLKTHPSWWVPNYGFSHYIVTYPRQYKFKYAFKYQYREESNANPINLKWQNYGTGTESTPLVFDENNLLFYNPAVDPNTKEFTITLPKRNVDGNIFITDQTDTKLLLPIEVKIVDLPNFAEHINTTEYILLTDSYFIKNDVEKLIDQYVNYKQTQFTNNVRLVLDNTLYDAFSYGIEHPLAFRYYAKYLLDQSTTVKPRFLFILGDGVEPLYNRGANYTNNKIAIDASNFIPFICSPASDNYITAGLGGTKAEPAIATGRFPAKTIDEFKTFFEKVKIHESVGNMYQEWRKNVLHLGGGINADQASIITSKMNFLGDYFVKRPPYAGTYKHFSKVANGINDAELPFRISNEMNQGIGVITFLGHGSADKTDIPLPPKYINAGKFPIFYFNGCSIGRLGIPLLPANDLNISQNAMKSDKGAIAFVAQSSLSELYTVLQQMTSVYKYLFVDPNNKYTTIGEALKYGIADFQRPYAPLNRAHCHQLLLQGDPSTPLYRPLQPDLVINKGGLFITPYNANALSDSFEVGVIVRNNGKYTGDSFRIELTRTYDVTTKFVYTKDVVLNKMLDTFYIVIKSKDARTKGLNLFEVNVNSLEKPTEITYANNRLNYEFNMPGNGINLVHPKKYDIIASKSVTLKVQPSDLFRELYGFFIEIDTTPNFNSPYLRKVNGNQSVQASVLAEWTINDLNPTKDTQEYFWRARLNTNKLNGGDWVISTFTYIKDHPTGWMQNNAYQYILPTSLNSHKGLSVDSSKKSFIYNPIAKQLYLDCSYQYFSGMGVKEGGFEAQDLNFGIGQAIPKGLVLMFWDSKKLIRTPIDTSICLPAGYWGSRWKTGLNMHFEDYQIYYGFNMGDTNHQNKLIKVLNYIPDSMYVTIFTYSQSDAHLWKPEVMQALNKIGCNAMDTLTRTQDMVYLAVGKKGWNAGKAKEQIGYGKYTQLQSEIVGEGFSGSMTSEYIGPADSFYTAYFTQVKSSLPLEQDSLFVEIIGSNRKGEKNILATSKTSPIDLSFIDAKTYPYISLRVKTFDLGKHSSPNLVNWRVTHNQVPDGSLYPSIAQGYQFNKDTLYEGDTFYTVIPFKNISKIDFRDSLELKYELNNKDNRISVAKGNYKIAPLKVDSVYYFKFSQQTSGLAGIYSFNISINADGIVPEATLLNNSSTLSFVVAKDNINPLLDVTFDGRHIMDGDLVGSSPKILITSTDENKFLLQNNPDKISIEIQYPGSTTFTKINFGTDAIFYPATDKNNRAKVEFNPSNLATGTYILKVQSEDVSSNKAGKVEYIISFTVDRTQSISNFYPYPNPVTNSMKFVFTVTGDELPDDIKIKICNTSGVVVKEVSKADLGNIHIGNNITDWSWDGRDQFGDMLANGPYFYTVTVKHNGNNVKLKETKGDTAFKDQTGVIYLLR